MSTEDKVDEMHSRLLDPDTGAIARINEIGYLLEALRDDLKDHAESPGHPKLEARVSSLENDRAKVKGALVGATAGGGALGAALSKFLGLFS